MPEPQAPAGYQQPQEQGGVSGALTRQIGPLKAWQWGIAIGGAFLIWRLASGRGEGSPSTTAFVPGSADAGGGGINNGDDVGGLPKVETKVTRLFSHYSTILKKRTPIRDKAGKIVGYFTSGRKILLGKPIKIGGKNYYPILNMPGKYLVGSSLAKVTPVYGSQTTTTTTTPTGSDIQSEALQVFSNSVAAPTTTEQAQPYFGTRATEAFSGFAASGEPRIDTQTQISSITAAR